MALTTANAQSMEGRDMVYLTHYPDIKRWWRPERCVCGLRLRNCPDWRKFLDDLKGLRP